MKMEIAFGVMEPFKMPGEVFVFLLNMVLPLPSQAVFFSPFFTMLPSIIPSCRLERFQIYGPVWWHAEFPEEAKNMTLNITGAGPV